MEQSYHRTELWVHPSCNCLRQPKIEFELSAGCIHIGSEAMMSAFTDAEITYLKTQRLGRLATVGSHGQPHVVPVGFPYNLNEDAIEIGGHSGFAKRKKYRDVLQNPRVAFVVDDVPSVNPWTVRGIEIRGQAQVLEHGGTELGPGFDPQMFRIRPNRIISSGINSKNFYQQSARSVA
jgi:pyridoxamine 5'-phosphate oxidase family protein